MKALTIHQPYATLLAMGAKQFETRSWYTKYRGDLAIHAGKKWNQDIIARCYRAPFQQVLRELGFESAAGLPRGKILAIAEIDRIWKTEALPAPYLTEREEAFGNFARGRFAWKIDVKRLLDEPIPAQGQPSLSDWDPNGEFETIRQSATDE